MNDQNELLAATRASRLLHMSKVYFDDRVALHLPNRSTNSIRRYSQDDLLNWRSFLPEKTMYNIQEAVRFLDTSRYIFGKILRPHLTEYHLVGGGRPHFLIDELKDYKRLQSKGMKP